MRKYEAIIILIHQAAGERQKDELKKIDDVFSKFDAKVVARHDRGKKTLGYPMKKHKVGQVYIYDVEADPSKIDGLTKELRLEDDLLHVMISHPVASSEQSPKEEVVRSGS